jgi:ATP-binding cassette subfamily B protein
MVDKLKSDQSIDMFSATVNANTKQLEDLSVPSIVTTASRMEGCAKTICTLPSEVISLVTTLVSSVIILANENLLISIIEILMVIPIVITDLRYSKKMGKQSEEVHNSQKEINESFNRLNGFSTIKSMVQESHETHKITCVYDRYKDITLDRCKSYLQLTTLTSTVETICQVVLVIIGIYYIMKGEMIATQILLVISLTGNLIYPIRQFIGQMDEIITVNTTVEKFLDLLNIEQERDGSIQLESFDSSIELKDVSFSYDKTAGVLKDVNLRIPKGKRIGIYGPSGSGKSTLVNLLQRFYRVDNGMIMIDGININTLKSSSFRRLFGVVGQDVFIFNTTIRDNITYGIEHYDENMLIEACKKANAYDFIRRLPDGFDSTIGNNGVKLSGGERQRLLLARLFLLNPEIIILDEATSKLDNESEKLVKQAIDRLGKGKTVIAIAHRLTTIKDYDMLVGINEHTISEIGTRKELESKPDSMWNRLNNI